MLLLALLLQVGTWRDQPPPQYHRVVEVHVSYTDRERVIEWCGRRDVIACYRPGLNVVFMPVQCSPERRPMARLERIDIGDLVRNDTSFCGSLLAHEGGHVAGWPGDHSRLPPPNPPSL